VDASALEEVFSVREITIRTWLCRSGMQGKKLHDRFMLELELIHVQLDELWANVKRSTQDMWVWAACDVTTEIGAFITYCELLAGDTECPNIRPVVVQIRPARNDQPDLTKVLGTFLLSTRHSPKVYAYESAHPNLLLKPGTYFAMFKSAEMGRLAS
jgi:hypothetical protein